ncbi:hypothetical protein ACIBG0_15500 [Nocardia sp. NPDC050630]|uniref:hypothetical protein n=1 Tax=Nocardia sp. NPDC050630 TaxID=3364321 RepID=UPI0037973C97
MSESSSLHKKWQDWFFDCGVFGHQGLCLLDGYFRGQKMFNKLCLPVIRVKYTEDQDWLLAPKLGGGCGPYNDRISWDTEEFAEGFVTLPVGPYHLEEQDTQHEGMRYLRAEPVVVNGEDVFQTSVYARIGAYHIKQEYTLHNDGMIQPRVYSKGLSCNIDHDHNPYWRFDFSLGSPEVARVSVHHQSMFGNDLIADINTEGSVVNSFFGRMIEYRITSTQPPTVAAIRNPAQAVVVPPEPGSSEGVIGPTPFSGIDGYVRRYRPEEDRDWPKKEMDELSFVRNDPCIDTDIVFWSICHLHHHADKNNEHFHGVGPDIFLTPMTLANVPPEFFRLVEVSGKISIKDFKAVGKDKWKHVDFSDKVLVSPSSPNQEIIGIAQVGDTKGEFIIRPTWMMDNSISVEVIGNLFDETQRVAHLSGQFNVMRDSSMSGVKMHLVDYHKGDPDTADLTFDVSNQQK